MSLALKEQREKLVAEAQELRDALTAGTATDEQRERAAAITGELERVDSDLAFVASVDEIRNADTNEPIVDQDELRRAATSGQRGRVDVEERSPYGKNSANSWVRDSILLTDKRAAQSEKQKVEERLNAHYTATRDEASIEQVRAMATTGNASDLVAPAYVNDAFIEALGEVTTAATLVRNIPIDTDPYAHTTSVRVPKQTARVGIAEHTENDPLASDDVETSSVRVDVSRGGGIAAVPNFMLQRSVPGLDQIIMADLAAACAEDLNDHVLTTSKTYSKGFLAETGLGQSTYTATTPTAAGFYSAILGALSDVLTGVKRGGATGILLSPAYWFWLLGQLDADTRAYIGPKTPDVAIGVNGAPSGVGAVGHIIGVPVFLDAAIPNNLGDNTNETKAIVAKFDESWLLRSMPRFAVSEHAGFDNDQTKLRATVDRGFTCARRKDATSIVTGTGMKVA